jgi:curli biogenesis system outer membrane secretion channel CsgG
MRKTLLTLGGALLLTAALTACGGTEAAQPEQTEAAQTQTAQSTDPTAYIGGDAADLQTALGAPNATSYASSCIGDGEDGQWDYDTFTVYTYRAPDGTETVEDVLYLDE